MTSILWGVFNEYRIEAHTSKTITKSDYESYIFLHRIDLTQLKADVQQSQANEAFSSLLAQEQLSKDLHNGRHRVREKLLSLRSEGRLEMTLEKSRMRDVLLGAELNYQDLYSKIDTETSNGFATTEKLRHELFYSLTGKSVGYLF